MLFKLVGGQKFVICLISLLLDASLMLHPHNLMAAEQNPSWPGQRLSGLWEQYDEDTKQLSSLVRIIKLPDGHFEGIVEKTIPAPGESQNPICEKCEGERKGKAVLGMRIITNLWRSDALRYEMGEILDPDSGDVYRLRITIIDNGRKLDVRGYLGISLFGRSQIWHRVNTDAAVTH